MSIIMTSSNKMSKQIFFVYCSVEMNFKTLRMHGGFFIDELFSIFQIAINTWLDIAVAL